MKRKGLANIYWFVIALAVVMIIGLAWLSTEIAPLQYTAEMGRRQTIAFNGYIAAEQIRSYAEESARLAVFYALNKSNIDPTNPRCFDITDISSRNEFAEQHFTTALNTYMEEHPLENQYSDLIPPLYGRFYWVQPPSVSPPVTPDPEEDSVSKIYPIANGKALGILGVSDGEIQILNSRYFFIYTANGILSITVNCTDYANYLDKIKNGI